MSKPSIWVAGAGGHAKVVISTLRAAGCRIAGVLDDDRRKWGSRILGCRVSGPISKLRQGPPRRAVLAIGSNALRRTVSLKFASVRWTTAVHPAAYVDPDARIGEGTVVFAGAVVQAATVIGRHCIINTSASVDHDCQLGDFCHVAPGVHLAGEVTLGDGVIMGIGAVTRQRVRIGSWATVGAGAVVLSPLPAACVAVGIPAKPRKARAR